LAVELVATALHNQDAAASFLMVMFICNGLCLQDNEPLMRALSNLISLNQPELVLFVGEALVGNDAVDQLVKFNRSLADLAPGAAAGALRDCVQYVLKAWDELNVECMRSWWTGLPSLAAVILEHALAAVDDVSAVRGCPVDHGCSAPSASSPGFAHVCSSSLLCCSCVSCPPPGGPAKRQVIDGIVLTKFDTIDDKVGAALSMVYASGAPVMFVGCGQTYVDLKKLNVRSVVNSLLK
jgi:hypothetical protein